jgi:hypothetical protein
LDRQRFRSPEFKEQNQSADVDSQEATGGQNMSARSKRSEENKPRKQEKANLGQKEAQQQQRSESELSHMGDSTNPNSDGKKHRENE